MLLNSYGFPILEDGDFASATAMQRLAEAADAAFSAQEVIIDGLERPEAMITKVPSNQTAGVGSTFINFDTNVYISRTGAFAFGGIIFSSGIWRPGIYRIGCYVQFLMGASVSAVDADIQINDKRGFKLINDYTESSRTGEGGNSSRGAVDLTVEKMVEIQTTSATSVTGVAIVAGSASATVTTASRLWAYRVRGL